MIERRFFGATVVILATSVLVAAAQTAAPSNEPARDTILMSNVITKRTGVVTLAAVRQRGAVYDIEVRFGGPIKDYKRAMNAVVAAVAASTNQENYDAEWCYILTHEIGREKILISDIRATQKIGLSGKHDEAWKYFESKKTLVPKIVK